MKRRVITLLIFLLLGAIVNIAVAWGIALMRRPLEQTPPQSADCWASWHGVFVSMRQEFGATCIRTGGYFSHPNGISIAEFRELLPADSPFRGWEGGEDSHGKRTWDRPLLGYQCGLPCRALGSEHISTMMARKPLRPAIVQVRHEGALVLKSRMPAKPDVVVPWRPIWPGFALNTLFYAAILWLLLALPGALRRWRRIKCGLCPACAYPVGTSDLCTECGKPVTPFKAG